MYARVVHRSIRPANEFFTFVLQGLVNSQSNPSSCRFKFVFNHSFFKFLLRLSFVSTTRTRFLYFKPKCIIYTLKYNPVNVGSVAKLRHVLTIPIGMLGKKSSRPWKRPIVLSRYSTTHVFLEILKYWKPPEPCQKVVWSVLLRTNLLHHEERGY